MIALLNMLNLVIVVLGLFFVFKVKSVKNKVIATLLTVLVLVGYNQIQPSYVPKGTVKSLPVAEFKGSDKKIEDRMRKPVSQEERDAKRIQSEKETSERISELQHELKANK